MRRRSATISAADLSVPFAARKSSNRLRAGLSWLSRSSDFWMAFRAALTSSTRVLSCCGRIPCSYSRMPDSAASRASSAVPVEGLGLLDRNPLDNE